MNRPCKTFSIGLAATTLAVLGGSVPAADAGVVTLRQCGDGSGALAWSPLWAPLGPGVSVASGCGAGTGIRVTTGAVPAGGTSGVAFALPSESPNATIVHATALVGGLASHTGTMSSQLLANGAVAAERSDGGTDGSSALNALDAALPKATRTVAVVAACAADNAGPCTFPAGGEAFTVRQAALAIDDPVAPDAVLAARLPKTSSGSLVVSATSSDADSGVRAADLLVDGRLARQGEDACVPDTWPMCPTFRLERMRLDTTGWANGTHTVSIRVTDAAGNTRTKRLGTFRVTGSIGSVADGSRVRVAAHWSAGGGAILRGSVTASHRVAGRVADAGGNPVAGVRVSAVTAEALGAGRLRTAAAATSRPDGTFRLSIPRGVSRRVAVVARSPLVPGAHDPRLWLQTPIAPTVQRSSPALTHGGATLRLRGRLGSRSAARFVPRGTVVDIQARDGRSWRTIAQAKTAAAGVFHYRYRFGTVDRPYRFAFRAQLRQPFGSAASRAVSVDVNP